MSPKKKGGYSGAYRDSKDRIRPITPRKRSGAKTGVPIRQNKGTSSKRKSSRGSEEFNEFKRYIALSPSQSELHLTRVEINQHPRLSPREKSLLYEYIRARSGNMPSKPSGYYLPTERGESKYHVVRQENHPDSVYYNFDLMHVNSRKEWRVFLKKNKFKSVGGVDPDVERGGRLPRHIYRNPDGIILVTSSESPLVVLAPPKGGMKSGSKYESRETGEWNLGYTRFEGPKSKRKEMLKVLKDFRGPRAVKGFDVQGEDVGGIAAFIKQEVPNTSGAMFI